MLKGLWIAFRRVVDNARAGDADAADPYVLLCNTPEFSDRNNGDFDCDVPWIRGPGSERRVASAVGEDSTAIALAHQALKE